MAILKCKMCGGSLEVVENSTIVECEYCGTKQTVPTADNEKKINLFNRANRLRIGGEFDKAAAIYESIVAEFPEEAEAYWGLVLCKYGIEYVDDPVTAKKIPTCHRSSFESVMEDGNFEQVMENADTLSRMVYREEAKQIEELRKEIIEVSNKEEPYDIFICYKEADANGDRTIDSVMAQDTYVELVNLGYRVFFSRITLEDKLGKEYEPYIFAALNSARIMLVFGTDYEYFNAVWVKNEWSRYLQLMAKGEKKTLIPCYKNIDAYDMPKDFSKLQSQDMGKIGAIQDLLRGIEKILPKQKAKVVKETLVSGSDSNLPNVDSLLKRAFMFLEDGDFKSADEYCDKVLDINPECAEAYLGKMLSYLELEKESYLADLEDTFDDADFFDKVMRFADHDLKIRLDGYLKEIKDAKAIDMEEKQRRITLLAKRRKEVQSLTNLISASTFHYLGVKSDGTVIAVGCNDHGQCNVGKWRDIVSVSAGLNYSLGLKSDGTVVAVGCNNHGQCNVSKWRDIVSVSAGDECSFGVKSDGTVVAVGSNVFERCNVGKWRDIVSVSSAGTHSLGLRSDGTVVATGKDNWGTWDVEDLEDVVFVSVFDSRFICVKSDGTVVANGSYNYEIENSKDYKDIVSVSAKRFIGLKSDGTVAKFDSNACDAVVNWQNIVAISDYIGLKSDGTVVCDDNEYKNEIEKWKLFDNYLNYEEERRIKTEARRKKDEERRKEYEQLKQEELKRKKEEQHRQWITSNRCQYCGGEFKGMFAKKCSACGKAKDY